MTPVRGEEGDGLVGVALAAAGGDGVAFDSLVRATYRDVWRFCAHLDSPEAAEDLTQEVFLRALRSLAGYRGECSARTWLFVIARRTVADAIRKRRRRMRLDRAIIHLDEVPDPTGQVDAVQLLANLDVDRREAFVLTQIIGLSYAEAADVCRCAVGTIRSRVARARSELAKGIAASHESRDDGVRFLRPG